MKQKIIAMCVCFGILLGGGQAVMAAFAPSDQVRAVQQALNEAGYDCGKADGLAGKKTEAAVRAFEKDKGLPVDGVIDDALLELLGITGTEKPEAEKAEAEKTEAEKAEEKQKEVTYSSCSVGELVFDVPDEWIRSGSADGAEGAAVVFTVKEKPKTTVSITVPDRDDVAEDPGDQLLKDLAEEAMQRITGRSYDGKAEVYTLSNGSHAAMITGEQDDSDAEAGHDGQWLFCAFADTHAVSVLLTSGDPDVFSGNLADELDRVMTSFKGNAGE